MRLKKTLKKIEVPSRIKDVDLQKLENKKIQLDFFSKESIISLEIDEAICYRLYREIKDQLKLS